MDILPALRSPFPMAPADAPQRARRAVQRTLWRYADPDPGLVVAVVVAALSGDSEDGGVELRVIVPGRSFPVMTQQVTWSQLGDAVSLALGCSQDISGAEIRVRRRSAVPGPERLDK